MSALLRALMGQRMEETRENLATVTEFTTEIDSSADRITAPVGLQARIEQGKHYFISFDVDVSVASVSAPANFTQILSKWPNQFFDVTNFGTCGRGVFAGFKKTFHFERTVIAKKNDHDGVNPLILQYDSANIIGTYRAYNFRVVEV